MSDFRNPGYIHRCAECNQIAPDGVVPSPHNFVTVEDPYQEEENGECRGHQKPPRKLKVLRIQKAEFVHMLKLFYADARKHNPLAVVRSHQQGDPIPSFDPEKINVLVIYENNGTAPCFVRHCDGIEELSVEIEVES